MSTLTTDLTADLLDTLKNAFATAIRYEVPGAAQMRTDMLALYRAGQLDAAAVEVAVDHLMARSAVKAQAAADASSACLNCGGHHAAHSGSPCHVGPAPKPAPAAVPFEKGMIVTNAAGQVVRLYVSKAGNFYGKVRGDYGDWEYDRDAMRGARHLTADEARNIGLATERCVFCATPIETKESLAAGYGPDCADKYGLPWGNKNQG